jgi:hypothetical protein
LKLMPRVPVFIWAKVRVRVYVFVILMLEGD